MTLYPNMTKAQIRLRINEAKNLATRVRAALETAGELNERNDFEALHDKMLSDVSHLMFDLGALHFCIETDAELLRFSEDETAKREGARVLQFPRKQEGAV